MNIAYFSHQAELVIDANPARCLNFVKTRVFLLDFRFKYISCSCTPTKNNYPLCETAQCTYPRALISNKLVISSSLQNLQSKATRPAEAREEMTMATPRPRKPFFDHFRENVTDGFMVGMYGTIYHLRDKGGLQAICKKAAHLSCSAAVCFGVFSAIDYAMVSARQKEEPFLNCAVAAAGATGITFLPRGVRYTGGSALIGGALGGVLLGGLRLLEGGGQNLSPQPGSSRAR
jgi:hypothetical protein